MYGVKFVHDGELPAEHDFVMTHVGGESVLFIKQGCVNERTLEAAWAAYRLREQQMAKRRPRSA